jgi:hypothetical protein
MLTIVEPWHPLARRPDSLFDFVVGPDPERVVRARANCAPATLFTDILELATNPEIIRHTKGPLADERNMKIRAADYNYKIPEDSTSDPDLLERMKELFE